MSRLCLTAFAPIIGFILTPTHASAQYYAPQPAPYSAAHQPGGVGVDLGLRHSGFNPSVGAGLGPIGTGVGAGFGGNGIGSGVNVGVGPIGVSTDAGLGRNGLGGRGSAGFGNTGAAFESGLSSGGLGVGANARVFGIGGGTSVGIGNRGPSLGASLAFGQIGTLVIGSHRNSYPGARQTAYYTTPAHSAPYYRQQNYGNSAYYQIQPAYSQSAPIRYQAAQPVYHHPQGQTPVQVQYRASPCPERWTC